VNSGIQILKKNKYNLGLLLAAAVISVWKFPVLFTSPRFWAEEGVVSFGLTVREGLWAYYTYNMGYISILLNVTATLLSITDIYYAPYLTLGISLLFQLIVTSIIAFGNSEFWDTYPKKVIICLGLLILPQAEIWLNTICLQYWMCVAVFLIFFEKAEILKSGKKIWYRILLGVGCLNGITPCFFLPMYVVRAYLSKLKEHRIQAIIITSCSVLQGGVVAYSALTHNSHLAMRTSGRFLPLMHYVHKQFIWPFLGYPTDRMYSNFFAYLENVPSVLYTADMWFPQIFISSLVVFGLLIVADVRKSVNHRYLLAGFVILFVLTCKFALMNKLGGRYVFAPGVILFVLLVDRGFSSRTIVVRYLSIAVISVTLIFGLGSIPSRIFLEQPDLSGKMRSTGGNRTAVISQRSGPTVWGDRGGLSTCHVNSFANEQQCISEMFSPFVVVNLKS
jgi:hypothetical protein